MMIRHDYDYLPHDPKPRDYYRVIYDALLRTHDELGEAIAYFEQVHFDDVTGRDWIRPVLQELNDISDRIVALAKRANKEMVRHA